MASPAQQTQAQAFDTIKSAAKNSALIMALNEAAQQGDKKKFISILLNGYGRDFAEYVTQNPNSQDGIMALTGAASLFLNWNNKSAAAKAIGIAKVGGNAYSYLAGEGKSFWTKPIDATGKIPLTYGQAINMASTGLNVYDLVKNWKQYSAMERAIYGTGTAVSVANTYQSLAQPGGVFDYIGAALTSSGNTAAAGVTSGASFNSTGFFQGWGAGINPGTPNILSAGAGPTGFTIPGAGTSASAAQASSSLAAPTGLTATRTAASAAAPASSTASTATSTAATGSSTASSVGNLGFDAQMSGTALANPTTLQVAGGAFGVAAGAYSIYKGWEMPKGNGKMLNNMAAGASMGMGLYMMGAVTGPVGMAIGVGAYMASMAGRPVGKSADQNNRDYVRSNLQKIGLADSDYNVTLADGSFANIGVDGKGGSHTFTDKTKALYEHRQWQKLSPFEVDYTNELDYSTSLSGIALSRITNGGSSKAVDQLGAQLSNSALVGYNQEMTPDNFNATMNNMRAMYAKAGITDKNSALILASKAYEEGRIDQLQYFATVKGIDLAFDPDAYTKARTYSAGRYDGLRASLVGYEEPKKTPKYTLQDIDASAEMGETKFDLRQRVKSKAAAEELNRQTYNAERFPGATGGSGVSSPGSGTSGSANVADTSVGSRGRTMNIMGKDVNMVALAGTAGKENRFTSAKAAANREKYSSWKMAE